MIGTYTPRQLLPLISWEHFCHTWDVTTDSTQGVALINEAKRLIENDNSERLTARWMLHIVEAHAENDNIILADGTCLPFLRQQTPGSDGFCRSLSDLVDEHTPERICIFATSVGSAPINANGISDDPYIHLLNTTLADRLAEAAAEQLQLDVQKQKILKTGTIIRPAVGYPSIPDLSMNFLLDSVCHFQQIGISLTEHGMMRPHSSISGFIFSHPKARYFSISHISEEQLIDYANRRKMPIDELKKYVSII